MIEGIGSGTPGRLTPLWEETRPPVTYLAPRSAALDRQDPELDVAVVDQHVVADLEHGAQHGRADRDLAVARCILSGDHDRVSRL